MLSHLETWASYGRQYQFTDQFQSHAHTTMDDICEERYCYISLINGLFGSLHMIFRSSLVKFFNIANKSRVKLDQIHWDRKNSINKIFSIHKMHRNHRFDHMYYVHVSYFAHRLYTNRLMPMLVDNFILKVAFLIIFFLLEWQVRIDFESFKGR